MRRNKLRINTFFGLSYFVFSFFGSLIPDQSRNQGHFLNTSSDTRIEVSFGANPIGQVNPKADNLSFAESSESGPGNVSFISTKPTKLPIQGTTLVPPSYSESGRVYVEPTESFVNNVSCQTLSAIGRQVCSQYPNRTITVNGSPPPGTTYTWTVDRSLALNNDNIIGAQDQPN